MVATASAGSASIAACSGIDPKATKTSSVPAGTPSRQRATTAAMLAGSRASNAIVSARLPPRAARSAALRARSSRSRPARSTLAPASATRRANARAIADEAPNTSHVRPSGLVMPSCRLVDVWAKRRLEEQAARHVGAEAGVRIDRLERAAEFVEPRIHALEAGGRHQRVLGEIDAPAMVEREALELLEQGRRAGAPRQVERQREAALRERQQAAPLAAQGLEHGEERRRAGRRYGLEQARDAARRFGIRDHALELVEAALAVDAVPVEQRVERIEELLDRLA